MRARSIASEAWRNLLSGTSAAALLSIVLFMGLTALTVLDARTIVQNNQDIARWRGVGASIVTLSAPASVDGAACEALSSSSHITAVGAGRTVPDGLAITALPSAPPPLWEVTPGLATLLTTRAQGWPAPALPAFGATSAGNGGLLLSQSLFETLGRGPGGLVDTADGPATVIGLFPVPDDGRVNNLSYAVLTQVPAIGRFDFCWAEVWPPDPATTEALRAVIAPGTPPDSHVTIQQFNPSLGATVDPIARYKQRLTRSAPTAAALFGLAIGFVAVRRRRLELASALHAGVTRVAMTAQLMLETLGWTVGTVLLAGPFVCWAVTTDNPYPVGPGLSAAAITILAGVLGAWAGTLVGLSVTHEANLFRYFKTRT